MSAARGHELEELHRRFAAVNRCSMRTAQRNSKAKSAKWLEFLEAGGSVVAAASPPPPMELVLPPAPKCVDKDPLMMTPEEWLEVETWELLRTNAQTAKTSTDMLERSAAMRHHAELGQKWLMARRARQAAEERANRVVPVEEFYLVKALVAQIAGMISSVLELAPMLNRNDPGEARRGLEAWLQNQFNPLVTQLESECDNRLAAAA